MSVSTAVIGGSLSGSIAGFALSRAGHDVDVFERSPSPLVGRGASIILQEPLLGQCREAGILTDALAFNPVRRMDYVTRRPAGGGERWLGALHASAAAMTWSDLYSELRSRVPDERYHPGTEVSGVVPTDDGVTLSFAAGPDREFDLAVFADGYRSLGRELVDPDARSSRPDVVLIRGIVDETDADDHLEGRVVRVLYRGGHGIVYLIPGEDGSMEPGRRRVSCSFYLPAPDAPAAGDGSGDRSPDVGDHRSLVDSATRLPSGSEFLRRLREDLLPDYFSALVQRTVDFYVQPIFSIETTRHARNRLCLVGDAGSVFPPYSNSGVLKAVSNATTLAALDRDLSVDALSGWDEQQRDLDRRIGVASDRFAQDLIRDVPAVATMSTAAVNAFLTGVHPGMDLELPAES